MKLFNNILSIGFIENWNYKEHLKKYDSEKYDTIIEMLEFFGY